MGRLFGCKLLAELVQIHTRFAVIVTIFLALLVSPLGTAQENSLTKLQGGLEGVAPEIPFPDWFSQSFLEIADDAAEAADEGKHVMLYLHMNGCPYCYQMAMESFVDTPYADYIQKHFSVIELNWDGSREVTFSVGVTLPEKELIKHLGVRASPTTLFLDGAGKIIYRVDGYRDREIFKQMMDYVSSGAIKSEAFKDYLAGLDREKVFQLNDSDSNLTTIATENANLAELSNLPLMLLFESEFCVACQDFHQKILANAEAKALLQKFAVIRINTAGEKPLIGLDGQPTTERELAASLDMLEYEPGVLLYDNGQELRRVDHKLFRFHFVEGLRWVAEKHYQKHPKFYPWVDLRMAELIASGQKIQLTE